MASEEAGFWPKEAGFGQKKPVRPVGPYLSINKARRAVGLILLKKARRAVGLILLKKARRAVGLSNIVE